jgi:hypothetical protein
MVVKDKLKIIMQLVSWLKHPIYIIHRLSTMYGTKYYYYILLHPIRFIRDINRYIDWCNMIDRHR